MARFASWASAVNIISWLLMAIPGILLSPLSWPVLMTIPLSALIALMAGIMGFVSTTKLNERRAGQCVIGIFVGIINALVIGVVLAVIYQLANSKIW